MLKQVPVTDSAKLPAALAAVEPLVPQLHKNKESKEGADDLNETSVADTTMADSALSEARDDCDDKMAPPTNTLSALGDGIRKDSFDPTVVRKKDDDNSISGIQKQCGGAGESKDLDDNSAFDEDPVTPHDLRSINHNILARFMAAPFYAHAMHLLHTHKDDKAWDTLLPQLNIPITSQKRCIAVMRNNKLKAAKNPERNMTVKDQSPWRTLSQHNESMPKKNPQDKQAQTQQQQRGVHNVAQILQTKPFPLQLCNPNQANNIQPAISSQVIVHNPTYAQNVQQNNQNFVASASTAFKNFAPAPRYPYPQFFPPGFNGHYLNSFQMYQLANAHNVARVAAAPVPQATASKRFVLNETNMQFTTKLPVGFGFELNNEHSRSLAQSAAQTWSQQGEIALKKSKTSKGKGKNKTPRKSSSTTPNKSPRMSPILVPTTNEKKKGLPEGWTTKTFQRLSGSSVGHTDTYFYSPVTNIKFRSKNKNKYLCRDFG